MNITSYQGEQLLQTETLQSIKKDADLIMQNKDVAAAWQASRHIKTQLAGLPPDKVRPVLSDYRRLTANFKTLALPLLGWDEVKSLITNNLTFLDAKYLPAAGAALAAWLATQSDADQSSRRSELLKLLPPDSPLRSVLAPRPAYAEATAGKSAVSVVKISNHGGLFDKDESHELASHAQKIGEMNVAPLGTQGGAGVAENIFNFSASREDKDAFLRRVNALVASRLRDVRAQAEIREYLGRPFKVGGLGLSAALLDQAGGLIENEYNKLHNQTPARPAAPPPVEKEEKPAITPVVSRPEPDKNKPAPDQVAPKPPLKPAVKIEPIIETEQRVVRPVRTAPANDKPRLDDIKSAPARQAAPSVAGGPRTVSALDELKLLTMADWRRYGSPAEATKNILQKVQLLAQESFASRAQGVKMFRASALFRQYVALGQASLAQGKKLAESLADKTSNPDSMTQDDFFAIALLNGKLK